MIQKLGGEAVKAGSMDTRNKRLTDRVTTKTFDISILRLFTKAAALHGPRPADKRNETGMERASGSMTTVVFFPIVKLKGS